MSETKEVQDAFVSLREAVPDELLRWTDLANAAGFVIYGVRNTCIATSCALAAFLGLRGLPATLVRTEARIRRDGLPSVALGWEGDGSCRHKKLDGWRGHLAVVSGPFLLDPTIDQTLDNIPPLVFRINDPDNPQWVQSLCDDRGTFITYWRFPRQVGWKSTGAARPSAWRPILRIMQEEEGNQ